MTQIFYASCSRTLETKGFNSLAAAHEWIDTRNQEDEGLFKDDAGNWQPVRANHQESPARLLSDDEVIEFFGSN